MPAASCPVAGAGVVSMTGRIKTGACGSQAGVSPGGISVAGISGSGSAFSGVAGLPSSTALVAPAAAAVFKKMAKPITGRAAPFGAFAGSAKTPVAVWIGLVWFTFTSFRSDSNGFFTSGIRDPGLQPTRRRP
jgi:hypothetical protein